VTVALDGRNSLALALVSDGRLVTGCRRYPIRDSVMNTRPFFHHASPLARAIATAAVLLTASVPAYAQKDHAMNVHAADSMSFIVSRRAASDAEPSVQTRDRRVSLILRDTVIVLQLTDRGMTQMFEGDTNTSSGVGEAIFARMVRAGVSGLMDHGIAYRLSALRRAYVDGNALVLEDRAGTHIFEDTSYNGHHPMQDFKADEAERFAAAVQRAIAGRR
jgi:hypothetical protein